MAVRVRYQVESPARFRSHLHLVDGTGYFFFHGQTAGRGERVVLEVSFDVTGESLLLRGWVWARPRDNGMWLELPSAARALSWADAFSRRSDRRIASEQLVLVESLTRPALLCRLRDVSQGGARLAAAGSDVGACGERVRVSLPEAGAGGAPLDAQAFLAWSDGGEIGLTWIRSDLRTRIAANRLCEQSAGAWEGAGESTHLPSCPCAGPRRYEPLMVLG